MQYKITNPLFTTDINAHIPAGTIINLEPVEEVKVKAFVPKDRSKYYYLTTYFDIDWHKWDNDSEDAGLLKSGNCFRTKEDAQIAQAKVIELFNSFK